METDDTSITPEELRHLLLKGQSAPPGDDGVTYDVLRLILWLTSPTNPLFDLLNIRKESFLLAGNAVPSYPSLTQTNFDLHLSRPASVMSQDVRSPRDSCTSSSRNYNFTFSAPCLNGTHTQNIFC